jgi:hypothetical protein
MHVLQMDLALYYEENNFFLLFLFLIKSFSHVSAHFARSFYMRHFLANLIIWVNIFQMPRALFTILFFLLAERKVLVL